MHVRGIPLDVNVLCSSLAASSSIKMLRFEAQLWSEGPELVQRMQMYGLDYDHFTLSALLRVCTGLAAIELGSQVHANMICRTSYLERDVFLQSSLVEMYGRCGLVEKARHLFDLVGIRQEGNEEGKRDVFLWTPYGKNGRFCGWLEPGPKHYSPVVDLLCRASELEMAWNLASKNASNIISLWVALLSACNNFGNIELGNLVAQKALELDPQNSGIYVLLSNLYARFGIWNEIEKLRELMKEKRIEQKCRMQ
ncbi:PREDICTED: pentatricopeptide repeat-containing protein At1g77170-like [Nelumbo nucifera]|uniref:Pentatricopeptide repeat-containing protein At1g77170-like n=1 Tax=Nelumbo nucifera TaxID=4432 RepID=A0A1U8Q9H7_NELNU|nr:PREDICTED: pentatricopeptide repeat-containing protein At1g77170-like [Nelumbo nucifera]